MNEMRSDICTSIQPRTCWTVCILSLRVLDPSLCYRVNCDCLEVGQADLACLAQGKGLDWG